MNKNDKNKFILLTALGVVVIFFVVCFAIISKLEKRDRIIDTTSHSSVSKEDVVSLTKEDTSKEETSKDESSVSESVSQEEIPVDEVNDIDHSLDVLYEAFSDGYEFPDLSDYDFVFIGDSIFDMNNSPVSMPRQLEFYTNARVYNLSKYMSCAGESTNAKLALYGLTSSFLSGSQISNGQPGSFNTDIERFKADDHNGRKLVFFFNHCFNDYTFSTPMSNPGNKNDIDTYEGSLRANISSIKNAYPKATYVFMEPYIFGLNDCGNGLNTYGFTLYDYIDAAERISGELGVRLFNLRSYDYFAEYKTSYLLDDLVHPTDKCAKTIARLLCDYVINNLQ